MEVKIKQILRQAYIDYGDEVFGDSYKLNAYISDLLAEFPSEQKRLAVIIKENIVSKVVAEKSFEISRFIVYTEMLSDTYGMQKKIANKLLGYIFYALTGENYEVNIEEEIVSEVETKVETTSTVQSKAVEVVLDELYTNYNFDVEEKYFQKILEAAQKGNPDAQFRIGRCYDNGLHVKEDKKEANKWYTLAAEQNHPPALNNLGSLFEEAGAQEKAMLYYEQALNNGEVLAGYNLGLMHVNLFNKTKDEKCFDKAIVTYDKVLQIKNPMKYDSLPSFLKIKWKCATKGANICSQMVNSCTMLVEKMGKEGSKIIEEAKDIDKAVTERIAELENKKSSKSFLKKIFDDQAEERTLEASIQKDKQRASEYWIKAQSIANDIENMNQKNKEYIDKLKEFLDFAKEYDEECVKKIGISVKDVD